MHMPSSLLQAFGYLGSNVEKSDRISDEGNASKKREI